MRRFSAYSKKIKEFFKTVAMFEISKLFDQLKELEKNVHASYLFKS
jgi:hypothetical protein